MDQPFDEIHIFKRFYAYYTPSARSWVENHSKCNENMRLWLGVGIVCFILKQIKYLVQILYGAIWMPQYLMQCVLRKTVCSTSSVSERGDMDSENQCGDPENRITICEINSIKSDNIWGYIINIYIKPKDQTIKLYTFSPFVDDPVYYK